MSRSDHPTVSSRAGKSGMPPGSLVHVGIPKSEKSVINAAVYCAADLTEKHETTLSEALALRSDCGESSGKNLWINIDGLGDLAVLRDLGAAFAIHPLVLEDISNPSQRPKTEQYENYTFFVLRSYVATSKNGLESEQVSLILGKDFLLTIQEKKGDAFANISERLRNDNSRIRSKPVDYLAYTVLDCVVDGYFSILESFGSSLEDVETKIVEAPDQSSLKKLYSLKRKALELRRSIWPVRELLANLDRSDSLFVSASTRIYLRDVYSHVIEVIDTLEIYRETLSGLLDVYLSSLSNRMNEVMKVLTVITTIFMPLTFIAGVYGMNFDFMPELKSVYGYPAVLAVMLLIALLMFRAFKRKRWI